MKTTRLLVCTLWAIFSTCGYSASDLNIMFYNVYNLFDNAPDPDGKRDWTFLPASHRNKSYCSQISNPYYRKECQTTDWTNAHVELKLSQLTKAIRASSRQLPDMLAICEVENPEMVIALGRKLGYNYYEMTNSPDNRGIDVALLFNQRSDFKQMGEVLYHNVSTLPDSSKPTRDILEVTFRYKSEVLKVFVNHWPSQGAPAKVRVAVAKELKSIINARLRTNPDYNIVLVGDFNTTMDDTPHPFRDVLQNTDRVNVLYDAHDYFMGSPRVSTAAKRAMLPGTYYYTKDEQWNRFDRIFFNSRLADGKGVELDERTYNIPAPAILRYPHNNAQGFRPNRAMLNTLDPEKAGFSDHFPVMVTIR